MAAYLDYKLLPEACIYLNFEEYIDGNTSDLVKKPNISLSKRGRPPLLASVSFNLKR